MLSTKEYGGKNFSINFFSFFPSDFKICTGFIWTPSTGDCELLNMAEEAYTRYDVNETTGQTIYINKRVQHSKPFEGYYCIEVEIEYFYFSF